MVIIDGLTSSKHFLGFLEDGEPTADIAGTKVSGGVVYFDKRFFSSSDGAKSYFEKMSKDKSDNYEYKSGEESQSFVKIGGTESVEITDSDFALINALAYDKKRFTKDDYKVYDLYLANNIVDRDIDRFPKAFLNDLSKTIVEKSMIFVHDTNTLAQGMFFKSTLKKFTIDEAIEKFWKNHPLKVLRKNLEEIEKRDGGIYWMVSSIFVLSNQVELIDKLDAGIIRHASVKFRADDYKIIKDDKDNFMWREFISTGAGRTEAVEGSLVYVGAQYGAGLNEKVFTGNKTLNLDVGQLPDDCFAFVSDSKRLAPHHSPKDGLGANDSNIDASMIKKSLFDLGRIENTDTQKKVLQHLLVDAKKIGIDVDLSRFNLKKEINMILAAKSLDLSLPINSDTMESDVASASTAINMKVDSLKKELSDEKVKTQDLQKKSDQLDEYEKLGTIEEVKALQGVADDHKKGLVEKALTIGKKIGLVKDDEADAKKSEFEKMSVSNISDQIKAYENIAKDIPKGSQFNNKVNGNDAPGEKTFEVSSAGMRSYSM